MLKIHRFWEFIGHETWKTLVESTGKSYGFSYQDRVDGLYM